VVPSLFVRGLSVSVLLCSLLPGYWLYFVLGALVSVLGALVFGF